jgi:hypothetical protein
MPGYDIHTMSANFNMLLQHDWQISADKGWYRIPEEHAEKGELAFMQYANKNLGYSFNKGTSPTLGNTIIIDPNNSQNPGANNGFTMAYNQVKAGNHSLKSASHALAVLGFMQKLYTQKQTSDLGQWDLGFDSSKFHIYKVPTTPNEAAFLKKTADLLDTKRHQPPFPHIDIQTRMCTASGTVQRLKINDGRDTRDNLEILQKKIVQSFDICQAHVGSSIGLIHKLSLVR